MIIIILTLGPNTSSKALVKSVRKEMVPQLNTPRFPSLKWRNKPQEPNLAGLSKQTESNLICERGKVYFTSRPGIDRRLTEGPVLLEQFWRTAGNNYSGQK